MLTAIIGVMASCSSDDDDSKKDVPSSIIGNWEVISLISDGEELVESGEDCLDKYFITEDTARYLEYYESDNECVADQDDIEEYPILAYMYDGKTFVFDGSTYEIIEVTEDTIKWSETYTEEGETSTIIETLRKQ